jgi:hypothetical protein
MPGSDPSPSLSVSLYLSVCARFPLLCFSLPFSLSLSLSLTHTHTHAHTHTHKHMGYVCVWGGEGRGFGLYVGTIQLKDTEEAQDKAINAEPEFSQCALLTSISRM